MDDYYACKKIGENLFRRKTNEVDIQCHISEDGKNIMINGSGDCLHHLVEDSAIFMNKIAGLLIGETHDKS